MTILAAIDRQILLKKVPIVTGVYLKLYHKEGINSRFHAKASAVATPNAPQGMPIAMAQIDIMLLIMPHFKYLPVCPQEINTRPRVPATACMKPATASILKIPLISTHWSPSTTRITFSAQTQRKAKTGMLINANTKSNCE